MHIAYLSGIIPKFPGSLVEQIHLANNENLTKDLSLQTCPCGAHAGFLRAQWARASPHQT